MWGRGSRAKDDWVWSLAVLGERQLITSGRRAGLTGDEVRWVGLTCLLKEVETTAMYGKEIRNKLAAMRRRINLAEGRTEPLKSIINRAYKSF